MCEPPGASQSSSSVGKAQGGSPLTLPSTATRPRLAPRSVDMLRPLVLSACLVLAARAQLSVGRRTVDVVGTNETCTSGCFTTADFDIDNCGEVKKNRTLVPPATCDIVQPDDVKPCNEFADAFIANEVVLEKYLCVERTSLAAPTASAAPAWPQAGKWTLVGQGPGWCG